MAGSVDPPRRTPLGRQSEQNGVAWLFIHLVFLIGFRNRVAVLFQWMYSYFAYKRSARIITYPPAATPEATATPR